MKENDLSKMEVADSYARLLSTLPGAVYRCQIIPTEGVFSPEYSVILRFASQGICQLLNITYDELEFDVAMLESLILPEDLVKTRLETYNSYVENRPYQLMYRVQLKDNSIKWVWDQGVVVKTELGIMFQEGFMMDFSHYKEYELALKEENIKLQHSLDEVQGLGDIIGTSPVMLKLYDQIKKASLGTNNVLILGETGSGKELVARNIYNLSGQKGAFIPVNCGAIPEQLMESEFFGYEKGAFSGATQNKDGFIKAANNGTLFLDEVGELPLALQVKLLRTLENKQYTPVGGNYPETSSFRLICATHQDLPEMLKKKLMRSDFYFRINVLTLSVPPLREREGDIPLLISTYLKQNSIHETIPLKVRIAMEQYSWPGNVREMKNFIERYLILGDSALDSIMHERSMQESLLEDSFDFEKESSLDGAMDAFERKLILYAMEKCQWKQVKAANYLNVKLRTFQRKLKNHNIHR